MAELHLRNLPPEVHLWLRQRARAQGRSMSAEAVAILRAALHDAQPGVGRAHAIDQLRALRQRNHLGPDLPVAETLIRDDRDQSR